MSARQRTVDRWSALSVAQRDAALAALFTVGVQLELLAAGDAVAGSRPLQHLAFAVMTGSLVARRTRPLLSPVVVGLGLSFQTLLGEAPVAIGYLALFVVVYSVATYAGTRRRAALGLLAVLSSIAVYPLVTERVSLADEVVNAMIPTVVWALARTSQERLERAVEAERLRQRAARDEERRRVQAIAAERRRIARDLHDTVAHGVTLMVLQTEVAGGARGLDDDARTALEVAQAAGRACVDDLRRLLEVLREEDDAAPPSLEDLPALVAGARSAGARVEVEAAAGDVPPETAAVAYRLVQEALTNAARYAPGAAVAVRLCSAGSRLVVEVVDDGARGPVVPRQGTGHGLAGARERVDGLGGRLLVGPRDDGPGWRLRAELPLPAAVPA